MTKINSIFIYITIFLFSFPSNSCSKDEDKQEPVATVKIGGNEHKVLETGYFISDEHDNIRIQFIIEDFAATYKKSNIEIQIPKTLSDSWFKLTPENQNWLVLLRNVQIGNGANMGVISEGKVLIKQLGNKDKDNNCQFQVSFDITLTDGTKAVADIKTKFKNSSLRYGGR